MPSLFLRLFISLRSPLCNIAISLGTYIAKTTKNTKYMENICNKLYKKHLQLTAFTGKINVYKYTLG